MLVTGGFNGTIKLWDMAAGKRVAALKCDKGSVFSLAITQDGKVLAAACSECTVVIRLNGPTNKSSGPKYLAALYHLPGGEWAAISPDNRFVCSEGGRQYIAFRDNLSVYSASDLPELECPEGILQPVIQA